MIKQRVFVLFSAALLGACNNDHLAEPEAVRTVRIETVAASEVLAQRRFVGRVDALETVDLSFQVAGRLKELPVQQGSLVTKGQLIAALDPTDYRLAEREAAAQFEFAKLDVTRKRNLAATETIPKAMLDEAETTYKLRRVALDNARNNLGYTRIDAPFDALVTRRLLDNHTRIGPNQPVVRVQNVSTLRVKINVPEDLIKYLDAADLLKVEAVFPGKTGKRLPLRYLEHATEADAVAQTYEVTLALPRTDKSILPGMTVTVEVDSPFINGSDEITIPVSAIDTDSDGHTRVWLFDPDSETVSPHRIEIGATQAKRVPVVSGLSGGEQIVTAGGHLLHDGMKVLRFTGF
ncbi:MAG: efflux RND transporter periplasmic adaptor subunit [Gammaproteobacteria bacterium HGW-Gammaproteobacteria-10]|nr:MAG: efflux RND transporter periplasmic adaptor subunit [Gammaproteobacteria bacterium HGW-Gammaproteobacteria-10]